MSLQISAHGTREGVVKTVSSRHPKPAEGQQDKEVPHTSDRAQVENVRALLLAEIEALDKNVNGVRVHVEAFAHAGGRNIQIQIVPIKMDLA